MPAESGEHGHTLCWFVGFLIGFELVYRDRVGPLIQEAEELIRQRDRPIA